MCIRDRNRNAEFAALAMKTIESFLCIDFNNEYLGPPASIIYIKHINNSLLMPGSCKSALITKLTRFLFCMVKFFLSFQFSLLT